MSTRGTWRELALPDDANPFELAVSDGTIWFTEEGARRIGRYSESTDKFTEYDLPSGDSAEARGIAVGFGDVWFTEPYADKVGRLRDGKITEYSASDQSLPSGIAIGRQGQVWFTEPNGGTYGITTFGAVGELSY